VAGGKEALASTYYIHFKWSNSMKKSVLLLMLVLIFAVPALSQKPIESQAIPELQEWWRAPANEEGLGQYGVSYLPNFYHGKDAMAVSTKDKTMATWLNRFPGDRENVFTWQTSGTVLYGDLNADGIRDYVCGTRIYRGIQNGEPPESGTIRAINMQPNLVVDVNHDGYADVVDWYAGGGHVTGGVVAQIVYGRPDFKEMKVVQIPCASSMDSTMEMESMYMGTDGDMRILMFSYKQPKDNRQDFNGYVLFRATWKTGDTLPTYEKLAEVIRYRGTDITFDRGGTVYQSKYHSNIYFIAREFLAPYNNNVLVYDISKDTFEQKLKFYWGDASNITPLKQSIDGDKFEDWVLYKSGDETKIFSGGIILDGIPELQYKRNCTIVDRDTLEAGVVMAIGDVNGDSIPDLAVGTATNVPSCFRILLGRKPVNEVNEPVIENSPTFTLTDPTPHPLSRGKSAILSANILKSGEYYLELVDISGKHVAELKRQYLETGSQSIMLDITHIPIASGSYILRLKNETGMILGQRTIIVE
jgi:hypothetical protein